MPEVICLGSYTPASDVLVLDSSSSKVPVASPGYWKRYYAHRKKVLEDKAALAEQIANHTLDKNEIDEQVKKNWQKDGLVGVRKRVSAKDRALAKKQLTRDLAKKLTAQSLKFNKQFSFKKRT